MSDLDLLRVEMDLLWGPDLFGRTTHPPPPLAIATAGDRREVRFDPTITEEMSARLEAIIVRKDAYTLDSLGVQGGPSFLVSGDETAPSAPFRILDSSVPNVSPADVRRPAVWGNDEEWEELLHGRLGPWALAFSDQTVVGVCYTPVASHAAAEAGVWTDVAERGRGCAPLVTAAWANVARREFRTLFYSTSFENTASQAVARKLSLRPLGLIRQFSLRSED